MPFVTRVKLSLTPGNGGIGSSSYFGKGRTVFDGGNGGTGGSIILKRSEKHETLNHILKFDIVANNGYNGSRNNQKGKHGSDKIIYLSRQCRVKFLNKNDKYLNEYEINENNEYIEIKGTKGGIGSINSKNKDKNICISDTSTTYNIIVESFFDSNSIGIIFFPHINVLSSMLTNEFYNLCNNKLMYIQYKNNSKIYIFTLFDKHIINCLCSFRIVAFVYNNNTNVNKLKYKLNNVNANILLVHEESLQKFINSIDSVLAC